MREQAPFTREDLEDLDDKFLSKAFAVISMQEVKAGNRLPDVIAMRHDMDAGHSLATGVRMARWEAERGYRSTYYVLHTAPYWGTRELPAALEEIAICGHEIGIHADALAEAFKRMVDPDTILMEALDTLRGYGFPVRGVAGHGNPICNRDRAEGEGTFANDEQFTECARPQEGEPDRTITRGNHTLKLRPRPLADFGLAYEALFVALPIPWRYSDSGGKWQHADYEPTFDALAADFQSGHVRDRQLHLLVHPDWWAQAFDRVAVAA